MDHMEQQEFVEILEKQEKEYKLIETLFYDD